MRWPTGQVRALIPPGRRSEIVAYLLVGPLVLWILLTIGYPLISSIYYSLTDIGIIGSSYRMVGLKNYETLLKSTAFRRSLANTGIWLIGNALLQTVLGFGTALLLNRRGRFFEQLRTWSVLPWAIPTVAVSVIWQWLLNSSYGVLSYLLQSTHLISRPLNLFGTQTAALPSLIAINSWHWFPLMAVVILGGLQTIPEEVYEAAAVDGASPWQIFWKITFPLLSKVLFSMGLIGTLWSFNVVDIIYLITKGGPAGSTTTLSVYIYETAFRGYRFGEAAAASVLSTMLLAFFSWAYIRSLTPKEGSGTTR